MAANSENSNKSVWNSLEVTKLLVGLLTPLAIFAFTYFTNLAQTREAEFRAEQRIQEEAARQKREKIESEEHERFAQVLKYRAELWRTISPMMNDLYCYFLYVGHWKDLSPEIVVKTKRNLDKYVYSNSPFFSAEFLNKYSVFMSAAFQTGNGWGLDARLKSPPIRDSDRGKETMFAKLENDQYVKNTDAIHAAYYDWLSFATSEMKLQPVTQSLPKTPTAAEIGARLDKNR